MGETTHPVYANLLKHLARQDLEPLMQDIQRQNLEAFETDYQNAVDGCNACHQATGHAYVHISIPTSIPVDYLKLAPNTP